MLMNVVIGLERPCKILQASPEWLEEFDFSIHETLGRTLAMVQGPMTNPASIVSLIETVRRGKRAEIVVAFYDRNGQEALYNVCAVSVADPAGSDGLACMLSFIRCETMTWKEATVEDGTSKAILDVAAPCRVVHVSTEITELYDMLPHEMLGRSLKIIHGPNTDLRQWANLIDAGCRGVSTRALIMTCTRDCQEIYTEVRVVPVMGGNTDGDGSFMHLLMIITPVDILCPELPDVHITRGVEHVVESHKMADHQAHALTTNYDASRDAYYTSSEHAMLQNGAPDVIKGAVMSMHMSQVCQDSDTSRLPMPLPVPMRMQYPGRSQTLAPHEYLGNQLSYEEESRERQYLDLERLKAEQRAAKLEHAVRSGCNHTFDSYNTARPCRIQTPRPFLPSFDYLITPSEHARTHTYGSSHSTSSEHVYGSSCSPPSGHEYGSSHSHMLYPGHDDSHMGAHVHMLEQSRNAKLYCDAQALRASPVSHHNHRDTRSLHMAASPADAGLLCLVQMGYGSEMGGAVAQDTSPKEAADVFSTVIPRRKKKEGTMGMPVKQAVKPVTIALDVLDRLSSLSLSQAADTLGISSTAMKKSCRKLGVTRWPYKSDQPPSGKCLIDDAYVRKIQRKHTVSLKKGVALNAAGAGGLSPEP